MLVSTRITPENKKSGKVLYPTASPFAPGLPPNLYFFAPLLRRVISSPGQTWASYSVVTYYCPCGLFCHLLTLRGRTQYKYTKTKPLSDYFSAVK